MRYDQNLAIAISMALALPMSARSTQFENVGAENAENNIEFAINLVQPQSRFDFGPGETLILVPPEGVTFATELFGDASKRILPTPIKNGLTGEYMAVVYTIEGTISNDFEMTFTLDHGAQFVEKPKLGIKDQGDQWTTSHFEPKTGADSSSVTFSLPATVAKPIESNDQIMLLYKLQKVNVLAEPGQKINMTVKTSDAANPAQTIPVAQSIRAIDAYLTPIEAGQLHIAVSTGSTQFLGESGTTGEVVGYIDNYVAQIGAVTLSTAGPQVKREDGVSPFRIASDEVSANNSVLTILGGQFEASTALPGKVSLYKEGKDIITDQITSDSEGAWTAIWNLNSDELSDIANSSEPTSIQIRTNGTTPVNTIENPPHAILQIDFDDAGYQDIIAEADLRKILKDGTVCMVFNVPPPKAGVIGADTLAIRVTNRSALSGKLMGKLYSQDGGDPIWSGDLTTEEVSSWATARFTSEDIAKISGQTWDGRAVLEISTILPNIEVLALIRQNGIRMAPLSNLSEGVVPSCVRGGN